MKQIKSFYLALAMVIATAFRRIGLSQSGDWRSRHCTANNEGVAGTHHEATNKLSDASWPNRHCLVKIGSDSDHVALCTQAVEPYGWTDDAPAAGGDPIMVGILGISKRTILLNATTALAQGVGVYTCGTAGYVAGTPTVAGTYYKVGSTKEAAQETQDGQYLVEVEPIKPVKVVVIAALTSVQNATTAAVDLTTSEALANALKANYNALQADVAAIAGALATPALVIVI